MRGKYRLPMYLAAAMAALWLLIGSAIAESDPIVVRVGEIEYPMSVVEDAWHSSLNLYRGSEYDPDELASQLINRFVALGIVENKLIEAGQNDFTDSELEQFNAYAQQQYDQVWSQLRQRIRDSSDPATDEEITEWVKQQGYSIDAISLEAKVSARYSRMLKLYCDMIAITEDEALAYYQEQYVEPDRARYAEDIALYEQEILLSGSESFYQPEGYRYIKHIVLAYPESVQAQLAALDARLQEIKGRLDDAQIAISQAVLNEDDVDAAVAQYRVVQDELEALSEEADAIARQAIPLLSDTIDDILTRLEAGEAFEVLMNEYSTDPQMQNSNDPGYQIHPLSENWPKEVLECAFSLSAAGEIGGPVISSAGVNIIKYVSDAPCGPHELTDAEHTALMQTALESKQLDYLGTLIEDWYLRYDIETHPELLLQ